jgi:tetratricopeptide (TPR) repeat protein
MGSSAAPSSPWARLIAILLVAIAALTVDWRSAGFPFVNWDDPDLVIENRDVAHPSWAGLWRQWRYPTLGLYTPLAYTIWDALCIDRLPDARRFHALNIALHAGTSVLALLILAELTASLPAAVAGALLFAWHPAQVEAVAWVSGMNNLLAGFFSLAAVYLYVSSTHGARRGSVYYALATAAFVAALLSKPTAVVVPVLAGVIAIVALRRPKRIVARELISWIAIALPFAVIARIAQPAPDVFIPPPWGRLIVALDALAFYVIKLVLPLRLRIDYGRTPAWLLAHRGGWVMALIPLVLAIAAIARRRRIVPIFRAALIWVVVALLPVLGLTPFEFQINSTVADRYFYIAMLGPALALAAVLSRTARRDGREFVGSAPRTAFPEAMVRGPDPTHYRTGPADRPSPSPGTPGEGRGEGDSVGWAPPTTSPPKEVGSAHPTFYDAGSGRGRPTAIAAWSIVTILLTGLAIAHERQLSYWRSTDALVDHTLAINSNSLIAHRVRAFTLAHADRAHEAADEYLLALQLRPDDAALHFNLGNLLLTQLNNPAGAQQQYILAISANPKDPRFHQNRAAALNQLGQRGPALSELATSCRLFGDELAARGDTAAAEIQYQKAAAAEAGAAALPLPSTNPSMEPRREEN